MAGSSGVAAAGVARGPEQLPVHINLNGDYVTIARDAKRGTRRTAVYPNSAGAKISVSDHAKCRIDGQIWLSPGTVARLDAHPGFSLSCVACVSK